LGCKDDQSGFAFELQKTMVEHYNSLGVGIRWEEVEAGHSPFLSQIERTGEFVRRAVGEDI